MHFEQAVTEHVYWIGGNDFITPRFDNSVELPRGITYNSYFIDDEKTAVIDGTDSMIRDLYFENIDYLLHGRTLDYIVINHMEPDHSGTLLELASRYPRAKICGSPMALKMFEQYFHHPMKDRYVPLNEKLVIELGKHRLQFMNAPMVHWPEVTFTYEETEGILFSADAFGTFGVLNGSIFAGDVDYDSEYLGEARRYYMATTAKFGPQVLAAMKKVAARFAVKKLCPLHGPVFRKEEQINQIFELVANMAAWKPDLQSAVIFFASAYGNTAMAAQLFAGLLAKRGIKNLKLIDLCTTSESAAWAEVSRRSHIVFAAPTLNMGLYPAMHSFLLHCGSMLIQDRKVALIGNSSWAPNVSGKIMKDIVSGWKNCPILGDTVAIKSATGAGEMEALEALADVVAGDIKNEMIGKNE